MGDFLADADAGLLAQLLELEARRAGLDALRTAVEDATSSESALHVVELKRAHIKDLVIRRSGHLMPGAAARHAVSQAQNYLRTMDENREAVLTRHGVDARRASATVVIGHPRYVAGGITSREIAETPRTYNTHAARIEVITYETLLESAARTLALASAQQDPADRTAGRCSASATTRYGSATR
ncbi:Shedu anti-phage system protein SduA domain-containing protein [Streptomyces sp. NPDC086147]|uniref:Shedu anti-phage system protein SduA domain-containing protein n=1 Tax=Streptomyces sp. NPDC086147 TaxID=3155295 RepID=UPI0034509815